jgi:tRNA(Ile2)-agmatinylcytidine synthase
MRYLLAIDDTDSQFGRCTTHLAYRMISKLAADGCTFSAYPRLVRLNPNVPFKTRGNAAVCLPFECDDEDAAFRTACSLLLEEADVQNGANSGLVFVEDSSNSTFFRSLYLQALRGLVSHRSVLKALKQRGVRHFTVGNGMGVVGASASIGFSPQDDHTYELIAYRRREACGTTRVVDSSSVLRMEEETSPHTFNSFDHESGRVLIAPHGPDPVFLGIRADSPDVALAAFRMLEFREPLLGHVVYITNQCTDAHLAHRLRLPLSAYSSGWVEGVVESKDLGQGGHLYLEIRAGSRSVLCGIYEPSRDLRRIGGLLAVGDKVRFFGGVRRPTSKHPAIINVEKCEVISLSSVPRLANPRCRLCGSSMKSEGRDKGFQCRACGARSNSVRSVIRPDRVIVPGIYLPSPGAQRHLTKQFIRYGAELDGKIHPLIPGWISAPGLRAFQRPAQIG